PAVGWRIEAWGGTDDDSSSETTNTVFMNADKNVSVSFDMPRTITVGDVGYPTVELAVRDARTGDIVLVPPGVWYGPSILLNKPITLRSMDSNDPSATILDGTEYADRGIMFGNFADENCIVDGLTIQNCWWQPGISAADLECPGQNGWDGVDSEGGAIRIAAGASPTIKNCIIRDNMMRGGDAREGCGADETHNAGRGGWGGYARGGGVYCGKDSAPTFINCQIIDNHAGGGNGGDGGDEAVPGGLPNYGGNWSTVSMAIGDPCDPQFPIFPPYPDIHPEDLSFDLLPGVDLWTVWTVRGGPRHGQPYIGDYRWYSAYGGGVFCDTNSTITFVNCTINGNRTSGGMSGEGGNWVGGDNEPEPEISYQLPSYGGGVYCSADSNITFIGCTITDNTSVRPDEDLDAYFNPPPPGAPEHDRAYYHLDPYTGHGGGVCAEGTAMVTFVDCFVGRNKASLGGGIYYRDSNARVVDSEFESNVAYRGGALLGIDGPATVIGCDFTNNESFGMVTDPCGEEQDANVYDPNRNYYLPGDGAGMYADRMTGQVIDCTFIGNEAGASGGGVFFSGETVDDLKNCLLAGNMAGRSGGGVSASFLTQLQVSNCTIVDNLVSGSFFANKAGGGVYCSDGGNTLIIDSILWDNTADFGNEIAVGTNISSGAVSVTYSDVQGGALGVWVDPGCVLNWDEANNLPGTSADDPCFVFGDLGNFGGSGDFFLSQHLADSNFDTSPCVDRGSDIAHALDMYRHTTRTDGVLDGFDPSDYPDAQVDMGYHYLLRSDLVGDFDYDGKVDETDLYRFNMHWLNVGCEFP
ncbi:MAG: right-handed parallel beta-helix repeat-containing protein, partial [Planctomycetota bacterium]